MRLGKSIASWVYFKVLGIVAAIDVMNYREIFLDQTYKWLYERIKPNTLLLDIGASIGDTAIYFSMNLNVKEVWSYEADDKRYRKLLESIVHSRFSKIRPFHSRVQSLQDVLSKVVYQNAPVAIKCDVEGDEYKLFTKETQLRNVYAIMLEYHFGYRRLEAVLKDKGFTVSHTKARQGTLRMKEVGMLTAIKA
jgi:hypothetical protein